MKLIGKVVPKLEYLRSAFLNNRESSAQEEDKGKAFIYKLLYLLRAMDEPISAPRLAYLLARGFENYSDENYSDGNQISSKLYEWALDDEERKRLAAALEWYVYETRTSERG